MPNTQTLSTLSGVLGILGFVPYVLAVWRTRNLPPGSPGKVIPMKATWLIWSTLNTVLWANMTVKGSANPQIAGITTGSIIMAVLAWKYGVAEWSLLDKTCIAGAIAAGLIALVNPTWGISISLVVVMIAWLPTAQSAYLNPEQESRLAWTIFTSSSVCMALAITIWDIDHAGQPMAFLTNQSITALLAWVRWRP